jgi:hypothetical protein
MENRKHNRIIVEGMDLKAKTVLAKEVEVLNLSRSGVALMCTRRLNMGGSYTLRFPFRRRIVSITGVVKWIKLVGNTKNSRGAIIPEYSAGLAFKEGLSRDALELMENIEKSQQYQEERRKGIRFTISTPEKALLNLVQTYSIKAISMNGILIETFQELPLNTTFSMSLTLPEDENPIQCQGRIASCKKTPEKKEISYDIGIELLDLSKDNTTRLRNFIDDMKSFSDASELG